jgi:AraC-like DNA-binding protein
MDNENKSIKSVEDLSYLAPEYKDYEDAYTMALDYTYPIRYIIAGTTRPYHAYKNKRPPTKKHFIFEYVISGKGYIFINNAWHTLEKGCTYIVGKNDERNFYSDAKDPMGKIWVTFSSEYIESMLSNYGISSGVYNVNTLHYFENIYEISKSTLSQKEKMLSVASNLHDIIMTLASSLGELERSVDAHIENELISSIYTKASLEDIAARLFMSRSNLIRVFKKHRGITPYQFLLDKKLEIAKALLATTEISVKGISDKLGFADEHYFSHLFKQKVGLSPLKYKAKKRAM